MRDFPLRLQHSSGEITSLERDRVLVGFASPEAAAEADRVLSELGLMAEEEVELYRRDADRGVRLMKPLNRTDTRVWARTVDGTAFRAGSFKPPEQIIEWIAPVYRLEAQEHSDPFAVLSHVLLIDVDPRQEDRFLDSLDQYNLQKDPELSNYLGEYGYFRVQRPLEETAIEVRSRVLEQGHEMIRDVQFETMPMFVPLAYVPNDTMYPANSTNGLGQWNMRRIHAGGAGDTAWNISQGDPSVVICILDAGCDLGHPDLNFTSNGFNASGTGNGSPVASTNPGFSIAEAHGTACAGIAAALIDNGTGVAGIAGGCRILPVACRNWTSAEIARGIRFAAQNGARVISMSFGFVPDNYIGRWTVDLAIQYAFDQNVVMCAATGNANRRSIAYPASHGCVARIGC
jgi:hypothetical protein